MNKFIFRAKIEANNKEVDNLRIDTQVMTKIHLHIPKTILKHIKMWNEGGDNITQKFKLDLSFVSLMILKTTKKIKLFSGKI